MVEPNYLNIYMCFHYTLANFYFNSESTVFLSTPLTPSVYKSRDSLDPPLTFSPLSLSLALTHAIKCRVK